LTPRTKFLHRDAAREPQGAAKIPSLNPVRDLAQRRGLKIYAPEVSTLKKPARSSPPGSPMLVVCDYGQILSRD
jgi:methionyl-tRNA formyltransferase